MDAIAYERAAVAEPPRFFATAWAVLVGFVFAAVAVGVGAFASLELGLLGRDSMTHERPPAVDWPFPHAGLWSIAANALVTAGVLLTCAILAARRVSRLTGEPVSVPRTFAIVAVTGYAPYIAFRGLLSLHFLVALLATAFLVREYAVGIPPLALSRRACVALATGAVVLLGIPAAYGAVHPLWYSSYVAGATPTTEWGEQRVVFRPKTAGTVQYAFMLENFSRRKVTLLGVSGGNTPILHVVGAEPGFAFPHRSERVLRGTSIGHSEQQVITLVLGVLGCDHSIGTTTLDRVTVRYRIAGMTLSQPVALAIRPTVVCP
jgi:hypothetical protein